MIVNSFKLKKQILKTQTIATKTATQDTGQRISKESSK